MPELLTACTILFPAVLTFAAAAHSPRDAQGNPVVRGLRTFTGDVRSLFHLGAY